MEKAVSEDDLYNLAILAFKSFTEAYSAYPLKNILNIHDLDMNEVIF